MHRQRLIIWFHIRSLLDRLQTNGREPPAFIFAEEYFWHFSVIALTQGSVDLVDFIIFIILIINHEPSL